jgi:hypothetical protein
MKLIAAVARYTVLNSIKHVFIDCVPKLLPYYEAIGFIPTSKAFVHCEVGISQPMVLDLVKHGKRHSKECTTFGYFRMILRAKFFKLIACAKHRHSPILFR